MTIAEEMSEAFGAYYGPGDTFELVFNVIVELEGGQEEFKNVKYRAYGAEDIEQIMFTIQQAARRGEQIFLYPSKYKVKDIKGFFLQTLAAAPGITVFPPLGPEGGAHI